MKVYEFRFEESYAEGVLLVAAKDKDSAIKMSCEPYSTNWVFKRERTDLKYLEKDPKVILKCLYIE